MGADLQVLALALGLLGRNRQPCVEIVAVVDQVHHLLLLLDLGQLLVRHEALAEEDVVRIQR